MLANIQFRIVCHFGGRLIKRKINKYYLMFRMEVKLGLSSKGKTLIYGVRNKFLRIFALAKKRGR